jgi:hypothetical protein
MEKLRIIVGGFIGLLPAGGITWDYMQYPLGFSLLGHDVYYIEDTRLYPIYQKPGSAWDNASSCIGHLKNVMDYFGFKDRWAYRDEPSGQCFGLPEEKLKAICRTADVFVNVSCSTFLREEYLSIPVRILIDSDPMFTQIQYLSQQMFTPGSSGIRKLIQNHNFLFSFGENIGASDCRIPLCNLTWHTTRQPVCLDYWKAAPLPTNTAVNFTTLMNWTAAKKLSFNNEEWGQKGEELLKILPLPQQVPNIKLSIGIAQTGVENTTFPKSSLESYGWKILDPENVAGTWIQYQDFVQSSWGEFSVAKHTYVRANTGWFSCRSACYLASGRPVITQDTGWSKFIPSGKGLFAFNDMESAEIALNEAVKNKTKHAKAARGIAEEFFDSKKVLTDLLKHLK